MKHKRYAKGGSNYHAFMLSNPTVNRDWCDSHFSQCLDIPIQKCSQTNFSSVSDNSNLTSSESNPPSGEGSIQSGGMEAQVNSNWCDGHHSQCMDNYNNIQCNKGGSRRKKHNKHNKQEKTNDYFYRKYKKYKLKYKTLK
jgi:hypothetical protein